MAQITLAPDSELCRKILLRTEEVLTSNKTKGPDNYEFEGYSPEMVGFNIRFLHDKRLIDAQILSSVNGRYGLKCWPIVFEEQGMDFLEAARNEAVWKETFEQIKVRGVKQALKKMEKMLLETAGA